MRIFKRWQSKKSNVSANQKPVAELGMKIYPDKVEFNLHGDERKIGGALVTLMLNHQHIRRIITNSVIAVERECVRQESLSEMMAFNLN